jgi:hypothetical protein
MSRPVKVTVDCSTGIESIIELTDEEIAELEASSAIAHAKYLEEKAAEEAKATAKASALAKLTALGLTEDEAKAIAG